MLLAAGASRRFGRPKLLAEIDGLPMVRRSALAALETGLPLIVVVGAYADDVRASLRGLPVRFVHNAAWAQGMGGSIACAAAALADGGEMPAAVIILPADLPRVGGAQLTRLLEVHQQFAGRILVSDLGHAGGPPCLFPQHYFNALQQLSGDTGARSVVGSHPMEVTRVPMPEAAFDVDTPDDLRRLSSSFPGGRQADKPVESQC